MVCTIKSQFSGVQLALPPASAVLTQPYFPSITSIHCTFSQTGWLAFLLQCSESFHTYAFVLLSNLFTGIPVFPASVFKRLSPVQISLFKILLALPCWRQSTLLLSVLRASSVQSPGHFQFLSEVTDIHV